MRVLTRVPAARVASRRVAQRSSTKVFAKASLESWGQRFVVFLSPEQVSGLNPPLWMQRVPGGLPPGVFPSCAMEGGRARTLFRSPYLPHWVLPVVCC